MRPYLAVIKDSFREALASRVLWILLVLTTVMPLAVAPFAIKDHRPARLNASTIFDWSGLIQKLKAQAADSENSPGKTVWTMLQPGVRQKLDALPGDVDSVSPELSTEMIGEFNRLLAVRDLYDESAWHGIEIDPEGKELLRQTRDRMSEEELARLNRNLLESAFPEQIARSTHSEIYLSYFGWKLGEPLAMSRSQVTPLLKSILAGVMNFFVGTLAVLAAILVTAPVIPHTFEAGAIDLLLSKPISRPLLFLAKYLGGCAFILLNAGYFVVGLWVIVGLRFDLWSGKLLLCIPIFMFLFAIYYSVSSFAGVVWKNAIVSIVVTVLFWAACFVVGTTKNVIEQLFLKPLRLARLVPAGESLFALNDRGRVQLWNEDSRKWDHVLVSDQDVEAAGPIVIAPPTLGPVYDSQNDRILAVRLPLQSGMRLAAPDATLLVGNRVDQWTRTIGATPPRDPVGLFGSSDGTILLVTKQSVFRLQGDPQAKPRELKMLGLRVPLGGSRGPFVPAGPESPLRLTHPVATALNPDTGSIAVWNRGSLLVLDRGSDGKYQRGIEKEFETESKSAVLGFAGTTIVVALADGRIRVINGRDGSIAHEFRPEGKNQPRYVEAAPGGRWFIVIFHHYKTWMWDGQNEREITPPIVGRTDISAATFTGSNQLLVADRGTRVTEYEVEPFRALGHRAAEMTVLERVYRYAVLPVYTIFPKPGELDNMIAYLLTEQETAAVGPDAENLSTAQVKLNVKGPVWSSLAFTVVMLGLTCMYVRRADF